MLSSTRPSWLRLTVMFGAALALSVGCAKQPPKQVVLAEFQGTVDPTTGTLSFGTDDAGPRMVAVMAGFPTIDKNGHAGTAALPNSLELVTEQTSTSAADCGRPNAFCGKVTIRSFYAGSEIHNLYVQIISMTPGTGALGFSNSAHPAMDPVDGTAVNANFGLWAYPALLDGGNNDGTFSGTSTAGANAATRWWYFDNLTPQPHTFVARVIGELVTPAADATGLEATCGYDAAGANGTRRQLDTTTDCGECGRTSEGTACNYAVTGGYRDSSSAVEWSVGEGALCEIATACDTADAAGYVCRDLATDTANCGACGVTCGAGEVCNSGVCEVACAVGQSVCNSACCPAGSDCLSGTCVLSDVTQFSVGTDHACAITTDSRLSAITWVDNGAGTPTTTNNVVCWGQNHLSNWGNPVWTRALAAPELFPNFGQFHLNDDMRDVASGYLDSLAFSATPDISVRRWGSMAVLDFQNVVDGWHTRGTKSAIGAHHGCSLFNYLIGDELIGPNPEGIYCWGDNDAGQIGNDGDPALFCGPDGNGIIGQDRSTICFPLSLTGLNWITGASGSGLTGTDIAAGGDTTCVVEAAPGCAPDFGQCHGGGQTAGRVACWGDNTDGKAGQAAAGPFFAPVELPIIDGTTHVATQVAVGEHHGVARLSSGALAFWGRNAEGEHGDGSTTSTAGQVDIVTPAVPAVQVAAGADFTCYLGTDTNVYCAGANAYGQLGNGTTDPSTVFVQVIGLGGITAISAGGVGPPGGPNYGSACALDGDGIVYCWGNNTQGQLGRGDTTNSSLAAPVQVPSVPPLP
ncbi:MAG: hypothetical protein QM767_04920 [Anaeromyxobacter sp.]